MHVRKCVAGLLATIAALAMNSGHAFALSGTSLGIQAWVRDASQESCLTTPFGQVVNGCTAVAEVDLPAYTVDYDDQTYAGTWIKWDGNGSKPACQVISVTDSGALVSATPIDYASGTGWELKTGVVGASLGGAFIACWLNPGDRLSSYWWEHYS